MLIDAERTAKILLSEDNIIILTHAHPDGDTLGCGFALLRALKKTGKKACVLNNDEIHPKYSYLWNGIKQDNIDEEKAFVVSVDIATEELLGDNLQKRFTGRIKLAVDHHGSNTLFAQNVYLEADSAAACENMLMVIEAMGIEIDPDIATCIYTGISTDTGCFRFRNTTERTLLTAAKMMHAGADTEYVNEVMFDRKTRGELELERMVIESMEYDFDNQLAIAVITQNMYAESGTGEDDCDSIASLPRKIAGVKIGITIKERKNGTFKASIRSRKPYNASLIAQEFGGGGHENAAGCRYNGSLEDFQQAIKTVVAKVLE